MSNTIVIQGAYRPLTIPSVVGNYTLYKTIGKGAFAVVLNGVNNKTREAVAVKVIDRELIVKQNITRYTENELRLHSKLSHPNIVKVYDIFYLDEVIMIVMELCIMGDLYTIMKRHFVFSDEEQQRIAYELLSALDYLHQRSIIHRDIKAENVMFDQNFHPKLIDFGLAREEAYSRSTFVGTLDYIAPEILKGLQYDGKKSDIWALGVTLHVIATGNFPWVTRSAVKHVFDAKHDQIEILNEATGVMEQIIDKCLCIDPNKRPSCSELQKLIQIVPDQLENVMQNANYRAVSSDIFPNKRNVSALSKIAGSNNPLKNSAKIFIPMRKTRTKAKVL